MVASLVPKAGNELRFQDATLGSRGKVCLELQQLRLQKNGRFQVVQPDPFQCTDRNTLYQTSKLVRILTKYIRTPTIVKTIISSTAQSICRRGLADADLHVSAERLHNNMVSGESPLCALDSSLASSPRNSIDFVECHNDRHWNANVLRVH